MNIFSSIPSPTVSSFTLGAVTVHYYALFILAGIVVATVVTAGRMKARGMEAGAAIDIAIWAVPFGIIGGRLFHVFTHFNDYFGEGKDWVSMFKLWEGGLAIYGALIFGAIGAFIGSQVDIRFSEKLVIRSAGIKFLSFADALVPGLLAAQALGRWGNYFNVELFGEPTDLPWGLEVPYANPAYPVGLPEGVLFSPTFLYESLWSLLGIGVLLLLEARFNLRWGRMFGAYLIWYSTGRFFIEGIRLDPSEVFLGLRTNQWSAIFGFLIGLGILVYQNSRHSGIEVSGYLEGRGPRNVKDSATASTDESAIELPESEDQA
jgi:prolipoprotein diacylglyceryl transferase